MDEIYKRIEGLCTSAGVNITIMCKNAGVPRSALSDYKAGRIKSLSAEKLQKIAAYFDVSVDYLLGNEEKEKPADKGEQIDLSDIEIGFLGDYKELTEENKATVRDMVRLMRERQKEG